MDKSVIELASKGDIKAFKRIFDFYVPKMRSVCLRYAHTDFEADDILQEAFIKIHHNLKDFRHEGSFEGWIRRIVVNTAINHNKKNNHFYAFEQIEEAMDEGDDSAELVENAAAAELLKVLDELPEGYRLVFNLYVLEDYSHKEIGQILGISEGTSRSQYSKAKKMIKKLLSRQRNESDSSLISKNG